MGGGKEGKEKERLGKFAIEVDIYALKSSLRGIHPP